MLSSCWPMPKILVFIVLGSVIGCGRQAPPEKKKETDPKPVYDEGKHGKGELKYINGLPILIVEGTPEEIGNQIGTLTKKPLGRLLDFPKELLKTKLK